MKEEQSCEPPLSSSAARDASKDVVYSALVVAEEMVWERAVEEESAASLGLPLQWWWSPAQVLPLSRAAKLNLGLSSMMEELILALYQPLLTIKSTASS